MSDRLEFLLICLAAVIVVGLFINGTERTIKRHRDIGKDLD